MIGGRAAVVITMTVALVGAACSSSSGSASGRGSPTTTVGVTLTTRPRATTTTGPRASSAMAPGDDVFTLTSGGLVRSYRLHVPAAVADGSPRPLVLNLHGATQNGQLQELYSQMDANSDRHGYLVAYPDGTRIATTLTPDPVARDAQYGWNAGACCGLPVTKGVDDVDFLLQVISDVASRTPVDLRRVYVTGMSNGGMMAYAMAAEASDRIAAIASVAGQVEVAPIHPSRPVPTLEFHSVDDPIARWKGATDAQGRYQFSVMAGIDQWVAADGCSPTPGQGPALTQAAGTGGAPAAESATLVTYHGCRSATQVALWRFTGSGHVWPGSSANTGPKSSWALDGVGQGTTLVDADEAMWQFFSRYQLPAEP